MRDQFAKSLNYQIKKNKKIILLCGDIGNKLFDNIKNINKGKNFINCGVAEQSMVSIAAGLGFNKLKPIVYTITPFLIYRAFEQIKLDVCYNNSPVILVGTGSGFSYSHLGTTHHSLEDVALINSLPNINIYTPCDTKEVDFCLNEAIKSNKPCYIRLGKKGEPLINVNPRNKIKKNRLNKIFSGNNIAIICSGPIISEAIKARTLLLKKKISTSVYSCHSISLLNIKELKQLGKKYKLLVTLEEHGENGGLASIINNYLINNNIKILNMNTKKNFYHKIGSQNYMRKISKIDKNSIFKSIIKII